MSQDPRGDVEFLRNLVLRADADPAGEARHFLIWGLTWIAVFGLGAAFPASAVADAAALTLIVLVAFGPWAGLRLRVAARGPEADPGPLPLLWRAFNVAIVAAALLAYGLVAALRAWTAAPVQDGGIWLLIVGSAYLASSVFIRGLYGWVGAGLMAAGVAVPLLLPGVHAAGIAYAVVGGGGLLAASALARRARS